MCCTVHDMSISCQMLLFARNDGRCAVRSWKCGEGGSPDCGVAPEDDEEGVVDRSQGLSITPPAIPSSPSPIPPLLHPIPAAIREHTAQPHPRETQRDGAVPASRPQPTSQTSGSPGLPAMVDDRGLESDKEEEHHISIASLRSKFETLAHGHIHSRNAPVIAPKPARLPAPQQPAAASPAVSAAPPVAVIAKPDVAQVPKPDVAGPVSLASLARSS